MPLGAGAAPAGSSAGGYGVPDNAHAPVNAPLPDLNTGLSQGGRYVNSATKSYSFTADGRIQGEPNVHQLVKLAIMTVRGSSCIASLGQTFLQIQEQGADLQRQVSSAVTVAFADLVRAKLVQLVSVSVQQYPGAPDSAAFYINWRDLTSGLFNTEIIGP